jgi:hypothetical protein
VHAYGNKWALHVRVPTAAPGIVARLAERFDIVWAGAWSHNAHPALREVLGLPEQPWLRGGRRARGIAAQRQRKQRVLKFGGGIGEQHETAGRRMRFTTPRSLKCGEIPAV